MQHSWSVGAGWVGGLLFAKDGSAQVGRGLDGPVLTVAQRISPAGRNSYALETDSQGHPGTGHLDRRHRLLHCHNRRGSSLHRASGRRGWIATVGIVFGLLGMVIMLIVSSRWAL